jgi:hypothetical protein
MKVTINGYVHARQTKTYCAQTNEFAASLEYQIFPFDMSKHSSSDKVLVCEREIEIEIPDNFDIRGGLVKNLEREKRNAAVEYQKRVTELNEQIQSLLAIEG